MAKAASYAAAGGRSNYDYAPRYVSGVSYNPPGNSSVATEPGRPQKQKLTLSTSLKSLGNESRAGASPTTSPKSYQRNALRSTTRGIDTNMTSLTSATTTPVTAPPRSDSKHAKLHKRGGSGSSLTGPPSPFAGSHSQFPTPFATYEEPFPEISATPKIKPYLRKMSSSREDPNQGRLDLSKSTSENGALSGLGIQESSSRSASDVAFAHAGRRTPHMRTTSGGSQISTTSASFRPNLPFVHPMRQTPRPYTPPTGQSYASSLNDNEAQESDDIITDDEFRLGHGFRTRRSMSIPSTPQIQPTPLSQTHTVSDLGIVPKWTNSSQSNLSIKSGRSAKSSKSRLGRSRRNTERSADFAATSPSSRTSFDRAFPFVSRRSDPDPASRDERIRAARQRFEQKEANKDRKMQEEVARRRETEEARSARKEEKQIRKSEASERAKISKQYSRDGEGRKKGKGDREKRSEEFRSRSCDAYRPSHSSRNDWGATGPEKATRIQENRSHSSPSGWARFSTWLRTRLLSCGRKGA